MFRFLSLLLICSLALASNASAFSGLFAPVSRKHIQIVGSSTVYPFAAVIAETFGRDSDFRTPIVEATGTGGGFKLFCSGIGYEYPDFANASRQVKKSEIKRCNKNGIKDIGEIKIGYDGIVLANSIVGKKYKLSKAEIFLALAAKIPNKDGTKLIDNNYQKWSDINSKLPDIKIAIYGPPPTSGTRDAFVELVMEKACKKFKIFNKVFTDKKLRKKKCHLIRNDGAFIEAGENDNLIVQKLKNNENALGIFGFSFLEENHHIIQPVIINNIEPNFKNIVAGSYPVSRPLYIYYKKEHLKLITGMKDFVTEIISKNTIGNDGYLMQKGLIPLTDLELKKVRDKVLESL